jgi:signal transduction histidine kinase
MSKAPNADAGAYEVLIVDDDPLACEKLQRVISTAGFQCSTALSAAEALRLIEDRPHPIVLTDRVLPGVDGLELSRQLRSRASRHYQYILMLSALDSLEDVLSGFRAGVDDYLSKQASDAELIARLHAASRRIAVEESLLELNATLEERVYRRTAQLRAIVLELDAFSYTVSHHLRAPLRRISSAAHLLLTPKGVRGGKSGHERVQSIIAAAHSLSRLVDDLLSYTALRSMPMQPRSVAAAEIIQEVVEELRPSLAERNVVWEIGDMPTVSADPTMFVRLWRVLLENAVKFTRSRAEARIAITAEKRDGEWIFEIRDNGVGFDQEYADKLFEVFERLHHSREFEGVGMGLAVARRLVERHGGRIWARGQLDAGATFGFSLPVEGVKARRPKGTPHPPP